MGCGAGRDSRSMACGAGAGGASPDFAGPACDCGRIGRPFISRFLGKPFTSRSPSVKHIVDLIRQGRCTLLSALQQQQIMMLESTINAFVLSALSLEGARSSERQMIASSWLLMIASLAFSYATPIEKMHPVRPLKSLFHPAIFFSMLGQAVIHLFCMWTAVQMAREEMGPTKLAEVVAFHRKEALKEQREMEAEKAMEEGDYAASMMAMWISGFTL